MGTNTHDMRQTYVVSSAAQSFFSIAASFPHIPNSILISDGVNYTDFFTGYESQVSSQTSTWNQRVVVTGFDSALFAWLTKQPAVLSKVPYIVSCSPISAAGAPQLHVRVSFLTTSSAVTSTTNAIYLNTAATTSAAPASKTPIIISSTRAPTVAVPSPSTADVSAGNLSNQPTQPTASQEVVASPVPHSDQSDNQPTKPTTNQVGGAPSDQPVSPNPAGMSTNEPPQEPAQPTVTQDAIAPTAAPLNEPTEAVSNQGSNTPSVVPSEPLESQPTQPITDANGVSPAVSSQGGIPNLDPGAQATHTTNPVIVVIGSVTATVLSPSVVPVQNTNLNTGGHVVEVSGTAVASQGQSVANGETLQNPTIAKPTEPAASVVGNSFVPVSSGAYAIAGQTLNPGGSAIEISGTTYSLQTSGGVVVNGNTVSISTVAPQAPSAPAPVVIGEVTAAPLASDKYIVADQTLSRGGSAIEVSWTTYSLPPSASNVIVNGQAAPISTIQESPQPPATVVIGGVTAKPESSGAYYLVEGQTLSPGGSALEVSGVTYSLPTSGANIVINGATSFAQTDIRTVSAVVFGSATAVPLLAGGYVVGSQVISSGGSAVEISGTLYSLPTAGNSVVIDGKTTTIQTITAADDAVVTIGSQIYTAVAASAVPLIIASQTLIPGGDAIIVSGTTFSLPTDATNSIVINGQTTALATMASGIVGLPTGSQQFSFTPLNSGIVIASQTLHPGGPAITVKGETLSIPLHGTAVVVQSGSITMTEGLGGYIWQGIAASASDSTSATNLVSSTANMSETSSSAGVASTQAVAATGTKSASPIQTSTSGAEGGQSVSSYNSATTVLVVCLFVVILL
jgi:hypothetical protein